MDGSLFITWLGFMIPLVYSAGPNNVMCAASGAQAGFKNTLPFIGGVNASLFLVSLIIGLGIGRITTSFPVISRIVTIAGSVYLVYLAFKLIRAGSVKLKDKPVSPPAFRDGFILNALNPKGIVGLSIMFNEFIISGKALLYQVMVLSVLTVAISSSAHFLWAATGNVLSSFVKSRKALKIQGYVFGIMLAGVAIWMLFY